MSRGNFGRVPQSLIDSVRAVMENKTEEKPVEQINELSKKTLGSYVKQAADDKAGHDIAAKHSQKALDDMPTGTHARKGMRDTFINSLRKSDNRKQGINRAVDKMSEDYQVFVFSEEYGIGEVIGGDVDCVEVMFEEGIVHIDTSSIEMLEEVDSYEQLDELSSNVLASYKKAATNDPAFEKKKGKPSAATKATRAKRTAGLERAAAKLQNIRQKEREKHEADVEAAHIELHNHFMKEAPKILAKHGYTKAAEGDKKVTYVRPHESGHVNTVTLNKHHEAGRLWATDHQLSSSTGWSGNRHKTHNTVWDPSIKDKEKKEMMPHFEKAVIDAHNHYHMNESVDLEGVETIEEARRGRPPKVAKPETEEEGDLPRQHIMQQLQRAKLSMQGGVDVSFKDGSKHFVAGHHAAKILGKYSDMKPSEKEDFQSKIAQSHGELKKHL